MSRRTAKEHELYVLDIKIATCLRKMERDRKALKLLRTEENRRSTSLDSLRSKLAEFRSARKLAESGASVTPSASGSVTGTRASDQAMAMEAELARIRGR